MSADGVDSGLLKQCRRALQREFAGTQFDDDLLLSLLAINNNDVDAVRSFLRMRPGDAEPPQQNADGTPQGYYAKPAGLDKFKAMKMRAREDSKTQMRALFMSEASLEDHVRGQTESYAEYVSVLLLLLRNHLAMSTAVKGRILAVAMARRDGELVQYLLNNQSDHYGMLEVLRAVNILDAPRKARALNKRLRRLRAQGTARASTITATVVALNELREEGVVDLCGDSNVPAGYAGVRFSLTSSVSATVREWVSSIEPSKLSFYALSLPKEPWVSLAKIVHLHPQDFQLDWFLPVMFGGPAPEGSTLAVCQTLTMANMESLVREHQIPYSYLRTLFADPETEMPDPVRIAVAEYEDLKTILWYYEELGNPGVDGVIFNRLEAGEQPLLSYGKLLERLLLFKSAGAPFMDLLVPVAEKRLESMTLPLDPPVVVLGDASYSMDVAIRTATIIASLLAAMADADLKFFNDTVFDAPQIPRTITDVLEVATTVRADGLTAPAVALWPYYNSKEVVEVFVMVTDEIENIPSEDTFFAQLFYQYYNEVHPAKLVFVSFLEGAEEGRMVHALREFGIEPFQFRLDQRRPDLTKLDSLIGLLSCESQFFAKRSAEVAQALASGGLNSVVDVHGELAAAKAAQAAAEERALAAQRRADAADESTAATSCCICLDADANTVLLECGHICACLGCAEALTSCPLCRSPIARVVRIFQ